MINAKVYFDTQSDPRNPGWVCETDADGMPQYQLDANAPDAADEELLFKEARAFADGEIIIRR